MVDTDSRILEEPVKTFKLEAADILLIHTKKSLWGWIIRRATHCYWNHALMVCSLGDQEQGRDNTLVIDAKTGGSIEMDRLSKYLSRRDKYDVAVKRLEVDWFQDGSQWYKPGFRSLICDIAANEVTIKLDSKLSKVSKQIIRQITIILRFLRHRIFGPKQQPHLPWSIRPIQIKAFTCGGFVQWCYYKGVSQLVEEQGLGKSRLKDVVFNPRVKKKITPFELLTTTPADLADCSKLSWKYIIKDGVIREISRYAEAMLYSGATY